MIDAVRRTAFRRPTLFVSTAVTFVLIAALGAATVYAACGTANYTVTSSAPPPSGNWTDTSGALWSPAGGFPGCASGDTASDTNGSPTTIFVNSAIPNALAALTLDCNGCSIVIGAGGSLSLDGPGIVGSGASIQINGGTLNLGSSANLTMQSGSSISLSSPGTLNIGP
ncbi:MAG TPA: hypothetical protein VFN10_05615, partial [Thermoanaerobaculia bacterium]|nr:hypothetical protein [Thermoanaerobaculia bacterium]